MLKFFRWNCIRLKWISFISFRDIINGGCSIEYYKYYLFFIFMWNIVESIEYIIVDIIVNIK